VEEIVAELATRAHGIVTRAELRAADVTGRQIDRRITKGLLIPEYPGVYRAGHRARSRESDYMAATKAGGPGAALYNHAAGHLLGLLKGSSWPPPEVLTRTERKIEGLKTRRVRNPDPRDITVVNFIPVTTVPVTLVHLAAALGDEELARACHLAHVIYRVGPKHVEAVLKRTPRAKGAARLRAIITGDTKTLLSYLENGFIAILKAAGLPLPETNRYTDGHYVDCRWADKRVTVELVSFQFHNSRWSWDEDQEREREAYARGDQFRRYRYKDVFEQPERMLAELRELLGGELPAAVA
jgi:hypothetical protein